MAPQWIHDKNREGFHLLLSYASFIGEWEHWNDPHTADVVWSPSEPHSFPNARRVLYGPHFSILPDGKYFALPANDSRLLYIQPSQWVVNVWRDLGANGIPLFPAPFPVDIEAFQPIPTHRSKVFVYLKNRPHQETSQAIQLLHQQGFQPIIIDYEKGYNGAEYKQLLNEAIFGVWVGRVESQGFALEEALAMDVPLLVWSVVRMDQLQGIQHSYQHIHTKVDTAPYWDDRCGVLITQATELEQGLQRLLIGIQRQQFHPRRFIEETLSPKAVYENFWKPLTSV